MASAFSKRQSRLRKYQVVEFDHKKRFLRKLSEKDGIEIFMNLYEFGMRLSRQKTIVKSELERINHLVRAHVLLNKIKA